MQGLSGPEKFPGLSRNRPRIRFFRSKATPAKIPHAALGARMKPVTILMLSIKPGQVGITKPMEIILTVPQIIPLRPRRSKLRQRNLKTQLYFSVVLDLPSILIRHQNGAYRKLSSNERNLNTPAFRFSVDGKHFKHGAFGKR